MTRLLHPADMPSVLPIPSALRRLAKGLVTAAAALACLSAAPLVSAKGGPGAGAVAPTAVPGDILVVLSSSDAVTPLLTRYKLSIVGRFGQRPIFRLRVVGGADVNATITALSVEPGVLSAEPNLLHAPPESVKNLVWAVGTPGEYVAQWADAAIGLPAAHAMATGAGVRIAVMDTGFDMSHPALAGRWLAGRDLVDGNATPAETALPIQGGYGHGTHVAGLVAKAAPGAQIMPIRVLDNDGQGNAWVLAEALLYAADPDGNPATADGAQVISLSMAGHARTRLMATIATVVGCGVPDATIDLSDAGYNQDRDRCANQAGVVVVASAGNDASASLRAYPAAESAYGLVSVAASGADGKLARFSNSGGWISLAAPGDGITSSVPGGGYGTWSGTSMATPLVSGSAALIRQRYPQMQAKDVARCLVVTATPLGSTKLRQVSPSAALALLASDAKLCR